MIKLTYKHKYPKHFNTMSELKAFMQRLVGLKLDWTEFDIITNKSTANSVKI